MWRYRELLPVGDERNIVSFGEGYTPLIRVKKLGKELNLRNLWVKDEGQIPTGTFKARGIAAAVSKAKEFGIRKVAMASAGNAGGALAAYGARAGMDVSVIMPSDAPAATQLECSTAGAHLYLVEGSIADAGKIVKEGVKKYGWADLSTMKEPYRVEGKKTMGLELSEQMEWGLPDLIIYPTGGGTGILGMWKAFHELEKMGWITEDRPRMIAVQSEGCAPIVKAYEEGALETKMWEQPQTIAGGIRVPKAFADFLILKILRESGGKGVAVSDNEILAAAKKLAGEGISACPEGAATLTGLNELIDRGEIEKDERIVLFNTGTGLKYTQTYLNNVPIDVPTVRSINDIIL
jgi:threonine synthase